MSKTLILSREQINEIIDGTPYLDTTGDGLCGNSYANEIVVTGGGEDMEKRKPATSDEIGKFMGRHTNGWPGTRGARANGIGVVTECFTKKDFEAQLVNEMNQELKSVNNINVKIPDPNNPLESVDLPNKGTESNLARLKTEFKQKGDKEKYDAITKVLKAKRENANGNTEIKKSLGIQIRAPKKNKGVVHPQSSNKPLITTLTQENNN